MKESIKNILLVVFIIIAIIFYLQKDKDSSKIDDINKEFMDFKVQTEKREGEYRSFIDSIVVENDKLKSNISTRDSILNSLEHKEINYKDKTSYELQDIFNSRYPIK